MLIYTVMGETGEYSDYVSWAVVSFRDEELAKEFVEKATARAKEWELHRDNQYTSPSSEWSKYDPCMAMDYTGTDYFYYKTMLKEEI